MYTEKRQPIGTGVALPFHVDLTQTHFTELTDLVKRHYSNLFLSLLFMYLYILLQVILFRNTDLFEVEPIEFNTNLKFPVPSGCIINA